MKVDGQFPVDNDGNMIGEGSTTNTANWASVMEKAVAKYMEIYKTGGGTGGYEALNGEGPETILPMLTGVKTTSADAADTLSASDMKQTLQTAIASGAAITTGTANDVTYDNGKIVNAHGYAVLGLVVSNGQDCVQIRNPWGTSQTGNGYGTQPPDGGVSTIPLTDFVKNFDIRIVATQ
jgi:hypothetical protein